MLLGDRFPEAVSAAFRNAKAPLLGRIGILRTENSMLVVASRLLQDSENSFAIFRNFLLIKLLRLCSIQVEDQF